ncbi:MAG: DNA polymerase III subunit beta [Candidatus Nealsonbacteria bacterium]
MNLTILKENFIEGLKIIERVVGKNLTLPILNNVLISTEKNFLNLSATDLELGIKYWSLVKIEKEGKITIPIKILSNFINFLPDKKITLETKNQVLYINCENNKTQIKGLNAEEFPIIPRIENKEYLELNTSVFCDGFSQVVDFSTPNQTRPELSGIYLNFQKDRVQLTATDSFRLAEKTLYLEKKTDKECSFILPQKTVREFVNIFSEKKGKIKLYFSPNQVLFEYPMADFSHPQVQIISRLVEGEYPDYQGIIPKKYSIQITLSRNDFLNQVKAASLFSGKINEVKLKINPKKDGIEIFSQNPEYGENKNFLEGKVNCNPDTTEKEASFNFKFLIDGLLNIKSQKVVFELNGEDDPAVLKPAGDSSYIYVLMPIKSS